MWEEEKACGRLAVFVGLTRTNTQPDGEHGAIDILAKVATSVQKKETSLFGSASNNDAAVPSEDHKKKRKQNNKNRLRGKMVDSAKWLPPVVIARFETVWLDSWRYHDAECHFELYKKRMACRLAGEDISRPRTVPLRPILADDGSQAVVDDLDNISPPRRPEGFSGTLSIDTNMADTQPYPARAMIPGIVEAVSFWVDKFMYEKAEVAFYVQKYVEHERVHEVKSGSPDGKKPRSSPVQTPKAAAGEHHDAAKYAALENIWLQNAQYHDAEVRYYEREATEHLKAWQRAQASVGGAKTKKSKRQKQIKASKRATNEMDFVPKPFSVQIRGSAFKGVICEGSDSISLNRKTLGGAKKKFIGSVPLQLQTSPCGVAASHQGLGVATTTTTTTTMPPAQQQPPTMAAVPQLQESVWVDKFRYDDAECQYQQQLASQSNQDAESSGILQDIQRARNNIQKSLAGALQAAPEGGELLPRLKAVEQENRELKKHLQVLQQALSRVEARLSTLEKGSAGNPPVATACKLAQVKAVEEVNGNAKEEDDDIDLFGSDEDDGEAEKLREERVKAYSEKKAKKPVLIAKSSIVLDVKPWDDETDMAELEAKVRSVSMDGLLWGASKLLPVGYGIKKLQIQCVVEDDKVGTDILEEEITKFEDHVQSVDVAAFNKI
ncbi:elongation factor 1-delta isoform X2 [Petromyzon marinus]|uniref:Elongation factor 1-delta n=2 Tax=Petromyzon marinus TaxID=7757 RepID=A0AAJ7X021_PETMA|nr:elongation factor 1-delta isoform X2 [Petromyzon marinus]